MKKIKQFREAIADGLKDPRRVFTAILCGALSVGILSYNPFEQTGFQIGYSAKSQDCLPWSWYSLRVLPPAQVRRGDLVLMTTDLMEPYLADGEPIVKLIAALPGDTVRWTENQVFVNGMLWGEIHAHDLVAVPLEREVQVPPGKFLPMGTEESSFDGRYYGFVPIERIYGSASPLFALDWDTNLRIRHNEQAQELIRGLVRQPGTHPGPGSIQFSN